MKSFKFLTGKYFLKVAGLLFVLALFSSFIKMKTEDKNLEPTTHIVTIFRMKFNPENLQVKKGDTVIWINKDFVPHDVTEETSNKWTSKPLNQGYKWQKVIQKDVQYYCSLHKVMKGTITIVD